MKNTRMKQNSVNNKGFTILELVLATVVFSMVLVVLTQTIIRLNGSYYKGVIQTQTLHVAKNITSTLSQQIQTASSADSVFGSVVSSPPSINWNKSAAAANPAGYEGYVCIGNNEYIYQLGGLVVSIPSKYNEAYGSLILQNDSTCINPGPTISNATNNLGASLSSTGNVLSLVPTNMRLLKFNVTLVSNTKNLYKIDVKVAYGDDSNFDNNPADANYQKCYSSSYYCSVIELVTYVDKSS